MSDITPEDTLPSLEESATVEDLTPVEPSVPETVAPSGVTGRALVQDPVTGTWYLAVATDDAPPAT